LKCNYALTNDAALHETRRGVLSESTEVKTSHLSLDFTHTNKSLLERQEGEVNSHILFYTILIRTSLTQMYTLLP